MFQIASRLGDGVIWYVLILALPLLYGAAAVQPAIVMALTGMLGVALYKLLKRVFVRERPFITHSASTLAGAPLDRYSFPSGHTLHAVSFTWQACGALPGAGLGSACRWRRSSPPRAWCSGCTTRPTCSPARPIGRVAGRARPDVSR